MRADLHVLLDSFGPQLAQARATAMTQLEDLAGQLNTTVEALLNPAAQIICDLEGAVIAVRFHAGKPDTGAEIKTALEQAGQRPKYTAKPRDPSTNPGQTVAALASHSQQMLAHLQTMTASIDSIESAQEVSASNPARTVSLTYRGRFLTGVTCQESWASAASESEIESAVIEASRLALQTVRLTERNH